MLCKEDMTIEFILINTPKIFFHKYMTRLTNNEIVKERILVKATQERLEAFEKFHLLQSRILHMWRHVRKHPEDVEAKQLLDKWQQECNELSEIAREDDEVIHKNTKSFLCPVLDCSGLVKNGMCGSCRKHVCASCREVRGETHECNKDTIETIKLLTKDTKPCPKCTTLIHKIDGCDQMFCVKCHTAFSWNSGKIATGVIHNPHYFAWLRNEGRDGELARLNDNANMVGACGQDVRQAATTIFNHDYGKVLKVATECNLKDIVESDFVPRVLNETTVALRNLNDKVHNTETILFENRKLRERFLAQKKKMDHEKAERNWFNQLRLRFKRRVMMRELITIIDVFDQVMRQAVVAAKEDRDYKRMLTTIASVVTFLDEQLISHKKRHGIDNFTEISYHIGLNCAIAED